MEGLPQNTNTAGNSTLPWANVEAAGIKEGKRMELQCPLKTNDSLGLCKKQKCAWWIERGDDPGKSGCAVKQIAMDIGDMESTLFDIKFNSIRGG